jgi:hypothetical protein
VRDFVLASDFTLARQGGTDVDVTAPLAFAGYRIDAPEYGCNDYAGIDVARKVVIILAREPQASDPKSPFKGTWDTFHAYPGWKPEVARRNVAAGVLIVQGPPRRPRRTASGPTNGQIRTDRPNQGAFHYVNNPIVPLDRTVAVLNMDMIGRDEESATRNIKPEDSRNSVNLVGTLYSLDLRRVIETENRALKLDLDFKTDKDDRETRFTRSDHYPFAIKGVPMVLFNTGEHPDYHTANDTWDRVDYRRWSGLSGSFICRRVTSLAVQKGRSS